MVMPTWLLGAILVAASAGGFLGYRVGAYRLAEVTAALTQTRQELDTQASQFQRTKQGLAEHADAIASAHQRELTTLQEQAAQDQAQLKGIHADAMQRVGALDARIAAMDRERAALRRNPPPPADAASTAQRLAVLEASRTTAVDEREGLACLSAIVPEPALAALRGR